MQTVLNLFAVAPPPLPNLGGGALSVHKTSMPRLRYVHAHICARGERCPQKWRQMPYGGEEGTLNRLHCPAGRGERNRYGGEEEEVTRTSETASVDAHHKECAFITSLHTYIHIPNHVNSHNEESLKEQSSI